MSIDPRTAPAEELLQALTVGDVAADDPAVAARLGGDAELRERWQELAATLADLRELDTGHRDGGGNDGASAGTRAAVRSFRRRAARRWWLVAASAAAALLLVLWLLDREPGPGPDPHLGGGGNRVVVGLEPADGVVWPPDAPLSWLPYPAAAGYRVEVKLPDGSVRVLPNGPTGEMIATKDLPTPVHRVSWLPKAPQRAALLAPFQWRVMAYDGGNALMAASAWVTTPR